MISGQDDSELSIFGRITQFSPTSRTGQIMASLTNHRGLSVLSAPADGAGGEAIRADFVNLVDWNPKNEWNASRNPGVNDDQSVNFYKGSCWLRTNTTPPQLFICTQETTGAAVWQPILSYLKQDSAPKLGGDLDVNDHRIVGDVEIGASTSDTLTLTSSNVTIPACTTYTRTAAAGTAEEIQKWRISDATTSYLKVCDASIDDEVFVPSIEGVQSAANAALVMTGTISNDTGPTPCIMLLTRKAGGAGPVVNRPLFQVQNSTQAGMVLTGGYNLMLSGPTTSPTLNIPHFDSVFLAPVDHAADDRRLYIQSEVGSPISIGNDRLDFSAATGRISIGGTDAISMTSTTTTLKGTFDLAIGETSTQKIGFYGATPIARRSGAAQAAVSVTSAVASSPWGYSTQAQADAIVTLVNELRAWAVAQGFIKGSA